MVGKPAARNTDRHVCFRVTGVVPHVGGPIKPPASPSVETNMLPAARVTDQLQCAGSPVPDFIVTGSTSVMIDGLMAARQTDKTMHGPPGNIAVGSPDVDIGGPVGGATLGNPKAGNTTCQLAAGGRTSGGTFQSYQNCGVEASRQVINRATGVESTPAAVIVRCNAYPQGPAS